MPNPAKSLIDSLQDDARGRAREAEKRLLYVAQKGAGWKILEFFVQNTAAWGSLWYFLVSFIGVTYSWGFYRQLDIDIFSFFDTPDFLLSAFQNTAVLIAGVLATFIGIVILVYSAYNSSLYSAYDLQRAVQRYRVRREALLRYRVRVRREALLLGLLTLAFIAVSFFSLWQLHQVLPKAVLYLISGVSGGILAFLVLFAYRFIRKHASNLDRRDNRFLRDERILLLIILIEATFLIPFLRGGVDSYEAREDASRSVRSVKLTLSQDRPKTPLPDRTLFLGATSSFHLFYECAEALKSADGTPKKCGKNGHPFVIPTTNIASLEFIPKDGLPHHVGSSTSTGAINDLDEIIKKLKSEEITVPDAIIQFNTIIARFNRSSETHTKLIIPKIESPEPESIAHLGPDQIATAIVAFQSYLEGKTPITHLNETIRNLADVPDSDLAQIAEAVENLHLTIEPPSVPVTVESPSVTVKPSITVDPPSITVLSNPDLSGVVGAIGDNTKKIVTAIQELDIPPKVQSDCASGWDKVTAIGPFRKEEHELLERGEELAPFITQIKRYFENKTLQQLMLVGRSDVTPLCKRTLALYGSNSGLAQARAKWILDELKKKFPKQKEKLERTILLSAGPRYVRDEATEINRAKDRTVEVYACWTPKDAE